MVDLLVASGQFGESAFQAAGGTDRGDDGIDDREWEAAGAQDGDEVGGALFGRAVDAVAGSRVPLGLQQAPAFPQAKDRCADADVGGDLADAGLPPDRVGPVASRLAERVGGGGDRGAFTGEFGVAVVDGGQRGGEVAPMDGAEDRAGAAVPRPGSCAPVAR